MVPETFHQIENIPVPPDGVLLPALDIVSTARYVGMYWEPAGDEFAWADGSSGVVGACWQSWLLWQRFWPPGACGTYAWVDAFGSSECHATHFLVLDRETRQVYAARKSEAWEFLQAQHRPLGAPAGLTGEQLLELLASMQEELDEMLDEMPMALSDEDIRQALLSERRNYDKLEAWLNKEAGRPIK